MRQKFAERKARVAGWELVVGAVLGNGRVYDETTEAIRSWMLNQCVGGVRMSQSRSDVLDRLQLVRPRGKLSYMWQSRRCSGGACGRVVAGP